MPLIESKHSNSGAPENCRTCVDFKSWTKQQQKSLSTTEKKDEKNEQMQQPNRSECPLDKDSLGRSTWSFLHTMAAHYPDDPSQRQQTEVKSFFGLLSRLYPCDHCAQDFQKEIKEMPVQADSQAELSNWLCRIHNKVNIKLGKPEFDCSKVNERWRDGWLDGSCD